MSPLRSGGALPESGSRQHRRFAIPASLLIVAATLSGCGGGGKFPTAPVRGKLTYGDGQPVTVGYITFSPIASEGDLEVGKSAEAQIQEDGTYVLSTYGNQDGAVIGKHRVEYFPPEQESVLQEAGGESNEAASDGEDGEGDESDVDRESSERAGKWDEYVRAHPEFNLQIPDDQRTVTVGDEQNELNFQLTPIE